MQFDSNFETIMETDVQIQAIVTILSQYYVVNRSKQLNYIKYNTKTLSASLSELANL